MGEAQRRQQPDAGAGMGLDREGDHAARRQHAGDIGEHGSKVVDVNKHNGGEDQIVLCGFGDLIRQKRRQITDDEPVVIAFRFVARNHRR